MKLFTVNHTKKSSSLLGKRYTKADVVLGLIQINGSVTTKQLTDAGIKNPGLVISYLRSIGVPIETKLVNVKCSNGVVRKSMAEYSLADRHANEGGN